MTDDYEPLKTRWLKQHGQQHNAHHVKILTAGLPARTRLRLAVHRRIDRAAIRLVNHGHYRAAGWLWRACRMW